MQEGVTLTDVMPRPEVRPVTSDHFMEVDGLVAYPDRGTYDRIQELTGGNPYKFGRQRRAVEISLGNKPVLGKSDTSIGVGGHYRSEFLGKYNSESGAITYIDPEGGLHAGYPTEENITLLRQSGYQRDADMPVLMNADAVLVDPKNPSSQELTQKWQQLVQEGREQAKKEQETKDATSTTE